MSQTLSSFSPPLVPKTLTTDTTLVSLVLLIGFAALLQAASLANTKTIKRLTREETIRFELDAIRELIRPLLAEAMIEFEGQPRLSLDSVPYAVDYEGQGFQVRAEREEVGQSGITTQPKSAKVEVLR